MFIENIKKEQNLIENVTKYLIENGFPKECILTESSMFPSNIYDIIVLDKSFSIPLFVFEIKISKNKDSMNRGINFLKKSHKILGNDIKYYIIFPSNEKPFFESYEVTKVLNIDTNNLYDSLESYKSYPVLDAYNLKQSSVEANLNISHVIEKREKLSLLKKICWIIFPVISIVLILLDHFTLFKLTTSRLIVYGVLSFVAFLPFIQQVGFGDYILKMNAENAKKDDESTKE